MNTKSHMGAVDIFIFISVVLASLGTGVYHAWRSRNDQTPENFMLGNRKLNVIPVGLSLMVSFQSAIMMQGLPTEAYLFGSQWLISIAADLFIYSLSAYFMIPFIHKLKMTSTNEYLEKRYKSKKIRLLVSVINNIGMINYLGMATFAPSLALEAAFGIPFWASVITIAFSTIIYTVLGGLKAVVWTDVLQSLVMYCSMLALIIQGTRKAGGSSYVFRVASESGRLQIFDFDTDPTKRHTFWSLFIGTIFMDLPDPFEQIRFQRISSIPTVKQARRMYLVTAFATSVLCTLGIAEGLVIYAYYHSIGCDPNTSKQISNPNQLVPLVWTELFSNISGLSGLFLAAIVAASLSTLSSVLNSCSVMIWEDFIKPHIRPVSDRRATIIIKIEVMVIGSFAMGLPFLYQNIGGSLSQMALLLRALSSSSSTTFAVGCLCPWVNVKGIVFGALTATSFTSWLTLGQILSKDTRTIPRLPPAPVDECPANLFFNQSTHLESLFNQSSVLLNISTTSSNPVLAEDSLTGLNYFYSISYRWFYALNFIIMLLVASLVSFITGKREGDDVHKYVLPIFTTLFEKWPKLARSVLPCYADYFLPLRSPLPSDEGEQELLKTKFDTEGKAVWQAIETDVLQSTDVNDFDITLKCKTEAQENPTKI